MKTMLFEQLVKLVQDQFSFMCETNKLFISSVSGDELWDTYINSFHPKVIFRDPNSSIDNCNKDKAFIRAYGNVVALDDDNNIITMWDVNIEGTRYEPSINKMRSMLTNAPIKNVFKVRYGDLVKLPYEKNTKTQDLYQLGYKPSYKVYTPEEVAKFGVVEEGKAYTFHHFHVLLPKSYILYSSESLSAYLGNTKITHEVFLKGLNIPLDTLQTIYELLAQGSLLRADLYQSKVEEFLRIKQEYDGVTTNKENWAWKKFQDVPFARFANELIGTTCIELAEGKDINKVCSDFNIRVDPANRLKAKAPITQSQIDAETKRIVELGYEDSFNRRFATIDDINSGNTINEVLHANSSDGKPKGSLFSDIKPTANKEFSRHKRAEFEGVEEVSIDTFLDVILPKASSIEVFLEDSFSKNLVTMTTSVNKECKPLFKWSNPFSWTYAGNLTGKSNLTERVISKGGRVDGVLRFSHSWNELERNQSLMDLHVFMPGNEGPGSKICEEYGFNNNRVGWNNRNHKASGGSQDVDYVDAAPEGYIPVENITFPSLNTLPDGEYKCMIHNWSFRNTGGKGKAEIAFGDELYEYIYPSTKHHEWVKIATVTLCNGEWSIQHHLEPINSKTKELWGLDTNQFHKVNLMCLSPNYWGDNTIGQKHYFFFLNGCHSDVPMRSFHIENLNGELLSGRKVLEVVSATRLLEPTDKQLAGLGFTSDSKETLIVKVQGTFKRTIRIKF